MTTETGAGQWGTALADGLRLLWPGPARCTWSRFPMSRSPSAGRSCVPSAPRVTPSPSMDHRGGPQDPGGAPRHHRQPGLRHLRGRGGGHPHRPATAMCWAACSTRCCCISPSSAWRPRPPWTSCGEYPGYRHRLRRRRLQPGRPHRPLHGRINSRAKRNPRIIAVEPASCPSLTRGKLRL